MSLFLRTAGNLVANAITKHTILAFLYVPSHLINDIFVGPRTSLTGLAKKVL
jgi:hypothetical protein